MRSNPEKSSGEVLESMYEKIEKGKNKQTYKL